MPAQIVCPNPDCGASYSVGDANLGKLGRCKRCGTKFPLVSVDRAGWPPSVSENGLGSFPKQAEPNLPESFGRYRIMKQLGRGGMGAVYLAHDTKLGRPVALKVPFFHPAEGPQAIQRFEREARAAATLDHPNLCPVFDVGEVDGIHYLTMPYIEGKPLSEAIGRDQTLSETQAVAIARKLALALQEAHDRGIIHRDLKPGNIMVNRRRELVIMDFGLARMTGGDDGPITRAGNVLGTALYMAPEQAAGDADATGPACDVYALGVILYELLTGHRPFEGPWSLVIGLKNVKDPDPPSTHRPALDPTLDAICLKAIAKEPENRYATMAQFADALSGYLSRTSPQVPTPSGTVSPGPSPESWAGQVFAGLIGQEVTSLREEKSPARTKPKPARSEGEPPRFPRQARIVAAAGAAAILLLGIIIYVAPDKGWIKSVINDPGDTPKPREISKTPAEKAARASSEADDTFVTNTLGMKLKLIPAGEFDMGSDASDPDAQPDEKADGKKHHVRITKPFYLGTTEVTVGQFRQFVEKSGYKTEAERVGTGGWGWNEAKSTFERDPKYTWRSPGFPQTVDHPVVLVSWNDAETLCEWLKKEEGQTYRLPTEAEWEYACRAGRTTLYSSGDDTESLATVGNVADGTGKKKFPRWTYAIKAKDDYVFTSPVSRFDRNEFGLYDMHGNVYEWCADWYDSDYYAKSPPANPLNSSEAAMRVIRGGSWCYDSRDCRSPRRSRFAPYDRGNFLGFRVARVRSGQ